MLQRLCDDELSTAYGIELPYVIGAQSGICAEDELAFLDRFDELAFRRQYGGLLRLVSSRDAHRHGNAVFIHA